MRGIKILCTALAVIFVMCTTLSAKGGIEWGIKGGFNLSQFHDFKIIYGYQSPHLTGFQFGMFDNLNITRNIQIHTEILYIRKGTIIVVPTGLEVFGFQYDTRIDYLEFPVLLNVCLIPNKPVQPYLIAGPYVSYRMRAKSANVKILEEKDGSEDIEDLKKYIEPWDFGLIGGAGVKLKLKSTMDQILVEARYEWGIVDIFKDTNRSKNSSFVFSVGVCF